MSEEHHPEGGENRRTRKYSKHNRKRSRKHIGKRSRKHSVKRRYRHRGGIG